MRSETIVISCLLACVVPFVMHGCRKQQQDTSKFTYRIDLEMSGYCMLPGINLSFSVVSSQHLDAGTRYQWNFGDGSTSETPSPQHSYSSAGVYNVTVTVNGHPGNAANRLIQIQSRKTSPYTSSLAGIRSWDGFRTRYDESTFFADSALAIEVSSQGAIKFLDMTMEITDIDTTGHMISYESCTDQAAMRYYYVTDSLSYSYRKQTGKLSGVVIEMHTN